MDNLDNLDKMGIHPKMDLAICMICRNVAFFLPMIFKNIERLSHYNLHLIFVYDNCRDETAKVLQMYKENSKFNVYIKETINNNSELRTVRIANARNECLKILYSLNDIQYHIVLDPDDTNSVSWENSHLIDHYINIDKTWDCISFNRENYYDIWALMVDDFKWHSWGWGEFSEYINKTINEYIKIKINNSKEDIECHSAFNGLAIYKTRRFKGIEYKGFISDIPKNFFKKEDLNKSISFINKLTKSDVFINFDTKKLDSTKNYHSNKPVIKPGEICEHIYYHIHAKRLNNCVIKISTKILQDIS